MKTADPTNLRDRLVDERDSILSELEASGRLPPGQLRLLADVQLAIQALDAQRGAAGGGR